jgi:signal transduction histidine kinase
MENSTNKAESKLRNLNIPHALFDFLIIVIAYVLAFSHTYLVTYLLIPDSFSQKLLGVVPTMPTNMSFFAIAVITLPLVLRRSFPKICLFLCLVSLYVVQLIAKDLEVSFIPLLIALSSLCSKRNLTESFIFSILSIIAEIILNLTIERTILSNFFLFQNVALLVAFAGIGIALRTSKDLIASANLRAMETERASRANSQKRLEEERVAIARELHDITAHSLSAISIQAAACEAQMDQNIDEAKNTISLIRRISKNSLSEIRHMIGVLREESAEEIGAELAPSMGTESLEEVREYLRAAGVDCKIDFNNYDSKLVPAYVDIAIFGICREAATNIVKHANASSSSIDIKIVEAQTPQDSDAKKATLNYVSLTITDNGVGLPKDYKSGDGHGVEGMGERVFALGGTFSIQNKEKYHGTEIIATFPLKNEK